MLLYRQTSRTLKYGLKPSRGKIKNHCVWQDAFLECLFSVFCCLFLLFPPSKLATFPAIPHLEKCHARRATTVRPKHAPGCTCLAQVHQQHFLNIFYSLGLTRIWLSLPRLPTLLLRDRGHFGAGNMAAPGSQMQSPVCGWYAFGLF